MRLGNNSGKSGEGDRWRGRPGLSALVRLAVALVPIAVSIASATVTAHVLPRPHHIAWLVGWWALVLGVPTLILLATDRLARRALPLAVLLKMTMVFPDQAPKRLALARRAGTTRDLARRVDEARAQGNVDEPVVAAEKILTLAAALNSHDRLTRGHGERVRAYTDLIADELHLPAADRDRLRWSALLHDIGKIAVHPDILNKAGKLDDHEWEVIKNHPLEGARLTAPLAGWLGAWADTIAEHHEQYDGTGYPYGLSADQISLGGRIVAVADAYDTMTAVRSYKRAISPEAARRELAACAGSQFDPQVVRAFLDVSIGRLRPITGPLAWLGSLPLVDSVPQLGQVASALGRVAATSVVVAGAVTAGALHAAGARPVATAPVRHLTVPTVAPPTSSTTSTIPPTTTTTTTTISPSTTTRTIPPSTTTTTSTPTTTATTIPPRTPTGSVGASHHKAPSTAGRKPVTSRRRPVKTPPTGKKTPPKAPPARANGGGTSKSGSPGNTGTHNRGLAGTSFEITVDRSTGSATSTYGSPVSLDETGLPPDAAGSVTFASTSPSVILCTVADYPAETSCQPSRATGAGTYTGISARFADTDGNYDGSTSANSLSLAVDPAALIVTASPTSTIYGSVPTVTPSYSGFQSGDTLASLASLPACSSTVSAVTAAGQYPAANTCTGGSATNYSLDYLAGAASVDRATLTVRASPTSTTYGASPVVTASYSGFQNSDSPGSLTTLAKCASTVAATTGTGLYAGANSCSGGEAANYLFAYVAADATVSPATLTVTASSSSSTYGTVPIVTAGYSGFLNSDDVGALVTLPSCSSTVMTTTPVGSYGGANACSGGADPNYSFDYVAGDAKVSPTMLTVTASSTATKYGSAPTVAPGYSGFQDGDGASSLETSPVCSSTVTGVSPIGTYAVANTCSGAAATNYSFTYVAGDATVTEATVTITASSSSTSYGSAPTVTASYSGFQNGDGIGSLTALPSCTSTVTATTAVGTYSGANTCSGAADPNYSFDYSSADATVSPAPLTVTASSTATTYGATPTVTPSYSGFENGDGPGSLTTLASCSSAVTALTVVGAYAGANTCSGAVAPDYAFAYVPANASVNQATLTVTASSSSTAYGTAPIVAPGYAGFMNSDGVGSLATLPSCASTVTLTTGVGSYTGANTCSGGADANYAFSYVPGDAVVSPAGLTVTASSASTSYGSAPVVTAIYSGFQNGDGVGSLTTAPSCSSTVSATAAAGTYTGANTCSGAVAANYSFVYVPGDETVDPAVLTVTASPGSNTYGTIPTVTASYAGFENGDGPSSLSTTPACSSSVTATTNVGTYAGANTCSGAAASNYVFDYVPGTATVSPATLTVTASATSTIYGTTPTVTASYAGFENGDGPSSLSTAPACSSSVTATTSVGTYAGANTCSGAAATNYAFAYVAGDATVTPVPALEIVNGSLTPGRVDLGDKIIVTFNPVPNLGHLCSAWSSTSFPEIDNPNVVVYGTAPFLGDDTLTFTDSTDCSGGLNLGTIDLGQAGYFFLGTTAFGGPSATCGGGNTSGCSSIQWDGSNTLTITLGPASFPQPIQAAPSVAVYTPAPQLGLSGTISSADEENF